MLLSLTFPDLEKSTVVVNHHPQGAGGRLSRTHEYYMLLSDSQMPAYLGEPVDDHQEDRSFMRSGTSDNNYRHGRWKSFYALLYNPITQSIVGVEDPVPLDEKYPTEDTLDGFKRIYPINSRGEERVWRSSYLTGRKRAENGELWLSDGGTVYQTIDHEDNRKVLFSNWTDSCFNAGTNGTNILKHMNINFDYPKSIGTLETGLWAQTYGNTHALVMDYFAGSGTTGHAVINMNRKFGGNRKYILIDMGAYLEKIIKPRIQKVIYSEDWNNGKPVSRKGSSHCFKYMRLEQYEDTLNNLVVKNNTLDSASEFYDSFLLGYMLDMETKDSLFNLKWFENPFNMKLLITRNNETVEEKVDLVETFNYLIGLYVDKISYPKPGICTVIGRTRKGKKTLVIWRDCTKVSNEMLNDFFRRSEYSVRDNEFDYIYVNGDNNLENMRTEEDTWKVVLIEQEFNKQMFNI
jgi:adenine-specific DNA-methyltransferase